MGNRGMFLASPGMVLQLPLWPILPLQVNFPRLASPLIPRGLPRGSSFSFAEKHEQKQGYRNTNAEGGKNKDYIVNAHDASFLPSAFNRCRESFSTVAR